MSTVLPEVPLADIATPISRIVEVIPGQSYRTIGVKWWGEGAYERATIDGSRTAAKTLSLVRQGDLIINKIWVRHGSTAIAGSNVDGCAASGEFPTFRLDETRVEPRWLHWQTKTRAFWAKCDALSQGTSGKNRIKPELFLTVRVPLPPLAEQQRVVARIEALALHIHEARSLREQAVQEVQSLVSCTQSVLSQPTDVKHFAIEDLVGKAGLRNGKSLKSTGADSEVRCLTLSSMRNGRINIRASKPVPMSREESAVFQVHSGDVYVVRGNGNKDFCGRAGYIAEEGAGVIFPDLFIHVALPRQRILPEFFVAVWNSSATRVVIEEKAKTTSGIWKINQQHILSTRIPVPTVSEQRRIVAELDALRIQIDALRRLQAETATEIDALLPSILDRAFKGEL